MIFLRGLFTILLLSSLNAAAESILPDSLSFETLDKDGDYRITLKEVKHLTNDKDLALQVFRMVDKNANLSIDQNEYDEFLMRLESHLEKSSSSRVNPENYLRK